MLNTMPFWKSSGKNFVKNSPEDNGRSSKPYQSLSKQGTLTNAGHIIIK
jgi:hypothetical protein